jgi:hypothetical protein
MNKLCTGCQSTEAHNQEQADALFGRRKTSSGKAAWNARCRECRREDAKNYREDKKAKRIAWLLQCARWGVTP